jgi:hypothetical protein
MLQPALNAQVSGCCIKPARFAHTMILSYLRFAGVGQSPIQLSMQPIRGRCLAMLNPCICAIILIAAAAVPSNASTAVPHSACRGAVLQLQQQLHSVCCQGTVDASI